MAKIVAKKKVAPTRIVKASVRRKLKTTAKVVKPKPAKAKVVAAPKARASGHNTETMLALLKGRTGATVAEIAKATGWLPHTTRAAISVANRKLGLNVAKTVEEGRGLVYRVDA